MKTKLFFLISIMVSGYHSEGQLSKTLSKFKDKVKSEILGEDTQNNNTQQLSQCACEEGETMFKFGGKFKINYRETEVCIGNDSKILLISRDNYEPQYYVSDNGSISGPLNEDNPKVVKFHCIGSDILELYSDYITEVNRKFLITFKGKEYGPYASILNFEVSLSKQKFVAITIKDDYTSGIDMEEAEKMDDANQEEQLAYALKMNAKMQQQIESGEELDMMPKIVTNIGGIDYNPMYGVEFSSTIKFNEICLVQYDKITDLNGKTVLALKTDMAVNGDNIWISNDNSRYAWFDYGTLFFSNGKKCDNVFSPGIVKEGNTEYIRYMYYSPNEDAIKMCKIPF